MRGPIRAIEGGDEETIRGHLADEIEVIGSDRTISRRRMVQSMMRLDAALDGMEHTVLDLLHEDGTFVVHLRLSGVFADPYRHPNHETGEEMVVEPTEEDIEGTAAYVLRFDEESRVAEMGSHGNEQAMTDVGVIEYGGKSAEAAE